MDYKPNDYFSVFISPLTERWIIVSHNELSALGAYGVKPGEKSRNELGAFLSAKFSKEIAKNIVYTSRLDLFSNYKHKPGNVDMFFTNSLCNAWQPRRGQQYDSAGFAALFSFSEGFNPSRHTKWP